MSSFKFQKAMAPAMMPGDGRGVTLTDKVVLGAAPGIGAPVANDTLDFLVPGGSRLCSLDFLGDQLDSNGAPALAYTIGYRPVNPNSSLAANATYFAGASTTLRGAAGAVTRQQCNFKPIKFEEDVYVSITITTPSATLPAGAELYAIADINAEGAK